MIHTLVFNKYFYKNKKSKLHFGDRVALRNDFIYKPEEYQSITKLMFRN
jgi:GTPase